MSDKVRVRFAPSPTGLLHIGGLRTALYNYLYARKHDGVFILRIEDTDQNRFVEGAEEDIIRSMRWAGLDFDEGPGKEGSFGPYRQSERSALYRQYAEQLVAQDQAYYAFDTVEQLDEMRDRLQKSGNPSPKYDAITRMSMTNSLTLPKEEVARRLETGEEYVIRLKVPRRETIRFFDEIRGWVSFESQGLDDQVLMKSDGLPTYHLANVVDDHLMEVTHVIRGEEWLSSAPKHILLYQYLGWEAPKMAHLPLIMSPAGGKLSKRKADELGLPVNVRDYVDSDYEPEALVNFLAFLGWNPGDDRELLTLQELIDSFDLAKVSKSGAIFDFQKFLWYNKQYLHKKDIKYLIDYIKLRIDHIAALNDRKIIKNLLERVDSKKQLIDELSYINYHNELKMIKNKNYHNDVHVNRFKENFSKINVENIKHINNIIHNNNVNLNDWNSNIIKNEFQVFSKQHNIPFKDLAQTTRFIASGSVAGPDAFETAEAIGREKFTSNVESFISYVEKQPYKKEDDPLSFTSIKLFNNEFNKE